MDSIGTILKECRESKGYSIAQVGADTHILPSYIDALEDNRFQDLPGNIYCLGFIKNLAKYYGLDENELAAVYKGESCVEKAAEPEKETKVVKIPDLEKNNKKILIAAGAGVLRSR